MIVPMMAGRADQTEVDHGSDGAMPRWAVGIAVALPALWAAYLLMSGGERGQGAAADKIVGTAPPETVEVLMTRTAAGATPPGPATAVGSLEDAAALVGPTWVAEDIQSRGVIDYLQSHITLEADGQAHGFGGCNNFTGRYTLEGRGLTFGPLGGTRKACPPAIMNQETRFHEALGETRAYRFENTLLFLLDAQGALVMRLWGRD
jgi:heat shock protein HslJ